jgi:O-antigen ligase
MFDYALLFSLFIALLAGQFARIELFQGLVNGYVQEGLLVVYLGYLLIRFGFGPLRKFFSQKIALALFIFFIISFCVSFIQFTFLQNSIGFLYFLRLLLYTLFGVYLFHLLSIKKEMRVALDSFIYTFSILLIIVSAVQYFFYSNFWNLYRYGWDPHLYRVSATYIDVYIAAALYGLLALFWFQKKKSILAVCFMIALVGTFSRSAYTAFILGILVLFISQKKWKVLLITLGLFVVFAAFMPKPFGEGVNLLRTASIEARTKDYQLALSLWKNKPLFGYGYNRIGSAKEQLNIVPENDRSHALASFHNSFLVILVSTGGIGLILFLFMLGKWFVKYPFLRIYFIYIICMSLFDNVLLHVLVILPIIFLLCSRYYSSLE